MVHFSEQLKKADILNKASEACVCEGIWRQKVKVAFWGPESY